MDLGKKLREIEVQPQRIPIEPRQVPAEPDREPAKLPAHEPATTRQGDRAWI